MTDPSIGKEWDGELHDIPPSPPPATGSLLMAEALKDGGTAGTKDTQCSYTYKVRWPGEATEILTGQTPTRARPGKGKLTSPCVSTWSLCWIYYDSNGDLKLWDANEIYQATPC